MEQLGPIAPLGAIYLDSATKASAIKGNDRIALDEVQALKDNELLDELFTILDEHATNSHLNTDKLVQLLSSSSSQLYRMVKALSSVSSIQSIQEVRLKYALKELKSDLRTISEIAFDPRFNSPT